MSISIPSEGPELVGRRVAERVATPHPTSSTGPRNDTPRPSISRVYRAPEWADFGALRGYRVGFSLTDALWSALGVHQDTLNIWLHAMGFCYFAWAIPHVTASLARVGAPTMDYYIFGFFLFCAMFQMLTSVLYHLLRCVSKSTNDLFLSLDMVGILAMICGSWVVGMTQGFYCSPATVVGYLAAMGGLMAMDAYFILQALRKTIPWMPAYLCIGGTVAFGLAPCIHMYLHCTGEHCVDVLQRGFFGMFGNYFTGFLFFLFRAPECFFPGTFDIIGHSHQLWHLFVFFAGRAVSGQCVCAHARTLP